MTWTPCKCPPPEAANKCLEGQKVICSCPGQADHMTTCLRDGTFDCNC